MREFLRRPMGWLVFQLAEVGILLVAFRLTRLAFPSLSDRALIGGLFVLVVVVWIGNYVFRRRYLGPYDFDD